MENASPENVRLQPVQQHLQDNKAACERHNVRVHVDMMNDDRTVAYCSVEQGQHGIFRREQAVSELVRQAEQALAPLMGLGITPMVTPRHAQLGNSPPGARRPRTTWLRLRAWLGLTRVQPTEPADDPFGWRLAMHHGPLNDTRSAARGLR